MQEDEDFRREDHLMPDFSGKTCQDNSFKESHRSGQMVQDLMIIQIYWGMEGHDIFLVFIDLCHTKDFALQTIIVREDIMIGHLEADILPHPIATPE